MPNDIDIKDIEQGSMRVSSESEKKVGDAYSNLPKGLTPEELSQSGTQKLILNDLSKAEIRIKELEPYREKYYEVFTQKSVLEEKLAKTKQSEILYSFCITTGGIIIGLAKLYLEQSEKLSVFMFVLGGLLILGGILFKMRFKK